jgi:spore maturation protein CgeB
LLRAKNSRAVRINEPIIMRRIILFGKSKRRTRTTFHLVRAFRERGNTILWLNPAKIRRRKKKDTDKWILKQVDAFNPDIVFIYSQDIPLNVLQQLAGSHIKTVMYYEDMTHELFPSLVQRGKLVDFFLATNKGMLGVYRKAGITNPFYFTGACDQYDHRMRRPVLPIWKSDIAFIGRARANEPRIALTRKLAEMFNIKVYGKNWKSFGFKPTLTTITPRTYALVCGGAKIVLGADITDQVAGYWSNRLWLTLGCGGFFLTAYVQGMEDFFENKKHLVWYHSEPECLSLAEEYLAKPEERRAIARRGYQLVHDHYTFHHFAERVIVLCCGTEFKSKTGS